MSRYLVLDMGGTSVKYGVLTEKGEILEHSSFKTPATLEEMYRNIVNIKNGYTGEEKFLGIALSCPGAVDSETGVIGGVSAIPYIHGPNIKKELEELTGLEVHLENDANCAALAEVWIGEAKENEDVVFIVIGTGVGGAIVKDKKIHKGKHLHAGEFGIMYFESDGVPGVWGKVSMGQLSIRLSEKLGKEVDGVEIFRLADEEKNEIVLEELEKWYSDLAKGIFAIQYVYDPEKIVIGGGISARPEILVEIRKEIDKLMEKIPVATICPDIQVCKFNNNANLIGALYNFLQRQS